VVDVLLDHGAHIDIANAKRAVAFDKLPANVNVFNHVSLQCLAARAIRVCPPTSVPWDSAKHVR